MTKTLCWLIYPLLVVIWIIFELVGLESIAVLIAFIATVLILIFTSIICPYLTIYKNRKWKKLKAIITDTEVVEEQEEKVYYSKVSYTHENQNFEILHTSTQRRSKNEKIHLYLNLENPTNIVPEDEVYLSDINRVIYGLIILTIAFVRIYMKNK